MRGLLLAGTAGLFLAFGAANAYAVKRYVSEKAPSEGG